MVCLDLVAADSREREELIAADLELLRHASSRRILGERRRGVGMNRALHKEPYLRWMPMVLGANLKRKRIKRICMQ